MHIYKTFLINKIESLKLLDVDFAVIFSVCVWLRARMWSERVFFRHLFIFYFVFWFQAERFLSGDKRIPVWLSDYCQQSRERATDAGLPGIYKYEIIHKKPSTRQSLWIETGAFPWRVGGANLACDFLLHARFDHVACHCLNLDTLWTQGLCFVQMNKLHWILRLGFVYNFFPAVKITRMNLFFSSTGRLHWVDDFGR